MSNNKTERLTEELYTSEFHARTNQKLQEGYLLPGTLIRSLEFSHDQLGQKLYRFLASADGGKTWMIQESYDNPKVESEPVTLPAG